MSDLRRSFEFIDPAFNKLVAAIAERDEPADPSIADLVRLALETLDIDGNEDRAASVLWSILLCDNLAEAIDGCL